MRILLLSQYYPPEAGATQNRLESFAHSCRDRGISITVLTAFPNYPAGKVFPAYRHRLSARETRDGIKVIRAWIWPRAGSGWISRGLTYGSFAISALLVGLLGTPRIDVLIWESPPLALGPTAFVLSRFKGARFVTNVSDLWPESLEALGILRREGIVYRFLESVEEFLYHHSAAVSGQTRHIIEAVRQRAREVPAILWRNGAGISPETSRSPALCREHWGIQSNRFVVGYAGLFGLPQGLEVLLQAAAITDPAQIVFVFVGDGPARPKLIQIAETRKLTNVVWVGTQPHEAMPAIWAAFDCAVICLRRLPLFRGAVPSKMYEAMAAGTPVILAVEGEAADILSECHAGIAVEPENPAQIAGAIATLQADQTLRRELGQNGKRAVEESFGRARLNDQYIDDLLKLV